MLRRHARMRGQALVELSLVLPVIALLSVGGFDIGRFVADTSIVAGADRAGMRAAQTNTTIDIGAAIRGEPGVSVSNTTAEWGLTGPGAGDGCGGGSAACGDPGGCVSASPFWSSGSPNACFAIGTCTLDGTRTPAACASPAVWGARAAPNSGSSVALIVRVVMRFVPATPLVAGFTSNGAFYAERDAIALPLY